jgi:hypothetical protein
MKKNAANGNYLRAGQGQCAFWPTHLRESSQPPVDLGCRERSEMIVIAQDREISSHPIRKMQLLISSHEAEDRPWGVVTTSALLALTALVAFALAALLVVNAIPLSYGSALLPGGYEQSGPIAFLIYGFITLTLAWALWTRRGWARRATVLLAAIGVALAVPGISSAVVDGRFLAMAREALQIMVRVAVIYYLSQEPVRDWFATRQA